MEHLQQLDIVGTNKWLLILSLSNQELHPSGVSFKHDFVCNVLKSTPLYPRNLFVVYVWGDIVQGPRL